jgi:hypothetical protein
MPPEAASYDRAVDCEPGIAKITARAAARPQHLLRASFPIEGRHSAVYVGDGEQPEPLPAELRDQLTAMLTTPDR